MTDFDVDARLDLLNVLRSMGYEGHDVTLTESGHDFVVCLDSMRRLVAALPGSDPSPVVKALTECITAYYEDDNPAGGNLHIVTDDLNLSDDDVEFCIRQADAEGDGPGAAIGRALLALPMAERGLAVVPVRCLTCGHSAGLHFKDLGGGMGATMAGPCKLSDCPCSELDPENPPDERIT